MNFKIAKHCFLILPITVALFGVSFAIKSNEPSIAGQIDESIRGIKATPCYVPSDPFYATQKQNSMSSVGNIEDVWDDYKGDGIKIAVIDSGIDADHPDFLRADNSSIIDSASRYYYTSGSTVYYYEYSKDASCIEYTYNTDTNAYNWHGSSVSGTLASPAQGVGTVGIAPNSSLLVLRTDFVLTSVSYAIRYAADQGAKVINMSFVAYASDFTDGNGVVHSGASSSTATALTSAINYAYGKGCILLAAAGNDNTDYPAYPACNEHVIGVGALGQNSLTTRASFSNFNGSNNTTGQYNVDVMAPGYVYAPYTSGTQSAPVHDYHVTQGTSFATPIVSGAAALWKQANPSGTPDQFLTALNDSVIDIGDTGWDNYYGQGRLDIRTLITAIPVTGVSISPTSLSLVVGETAQLTALITPSDATYQGVIWISDSDAIATVGETSGLVSAVAVGSTNIGVLTDYGSFDASISVVVSAATTPTLSSISLSGGASSAIFGSSYDTSAIAVTAHYSDNSTKDVTSSATIAAPNTKVLGPQTLEVSYVEGSISKTTSYTTNITNVGSTLPDSGTATFTFAPTSTSTNSLTTSNIGTYVTSSSASLTYSSSSTVTRVFPESANGFRFGSSSSVGTWTFALNKTLLLTSVSASVKKYSSDSSTVTINGKTSTTISSTSFYDITLDVDDASTDTITITGSKRFYIASLTLTYGGGTATFTNQEQAMAWANYFIGKIDSLCASDGSTSASNLVSIQSNWSSLSDEYGAMVASSKDYFVSASDTAITRCIELYSIIIQKYASSYSLNSFITNGNGEALSLAPSTSNSPIEEANDALLLLVATLPFVVFVVGFSYSLFKRKRA